MLSLALTEHVEQTGILAGYSSNCIALSCINVAAQVLHTKVLANQARVGMKKGDIHGVRCAYNSLWMQRDKIKKVIWNYNGFLSGLHPPLGPDGRLDKKLIREDLGSRGQLDQESCQSKKRKEKSHGGSPLRHVMFPPGSLVIVS